MCIDTNHLSWCDDKRICDFIQDQHAETNKQHQRSANGVSEYCMREFIYLGFVEPTPMDQKRGNNNVNGMLNDTISI